MAQILLIVDDEHDVEMLFRQRFRREVRRGEFELQFAFSGEEALTLLHQRDRTDVLLVLSDINMPGMTGIELLRRIKADPPPVPVCMMTAYGNPEYRAQAEAADGYLTKPIDFMLLKEQIHNLLTVRAA